MPHISAVFAIIRVIQSHQVENIHTARGEDYVRTHIWYREKVYWSCMLCRSACLEFENRTTNLKVGQSHES